MGLTPVYDAAGNRDNEANGYGLPNRKEIMLALATSTDSTQNLLASLNMATGPVKPNEFKSRPDHIEHLIGNVWEWNDESVADSARLILGGAYSTPPKFAGNLPEFCYKPDFSSPTIGFRCVLPAKTLLETP